MGMFEEPKPQPQPQPEPVVEEESPTSPVEESPQQQVQQPDELGVLRQQVAQQQQAIQQYQLYLQMLAAGRGQQVQTPPSEEATRVDPNDFFADPDTNTERVATRVVEKAVKEKLLPLAQHYIHTHQESMRQSAISQYNEIVNDSKYSPFLEQYKGVFDQTLSTIPLDVVSKPGSVKAVLKWVKAVYEDESTHPPKQPNIALNVPQVSGKVSASVGVNSAGAKPLVKLTEDEARIAKKQGLSPEEYAKYRDNVYG